MTKTGSANGSFFGNLIYERLLSKRDHFLKDLAQTVDFRFVREACRDFYVDWGRDAWDPVATGGGPVYVEDLAPRQSDEEQAVKGPPARAAFDADGVDVQNGLPAISL